MKRFKNILYILDGTAITQEGSAEKIATLARLPESLLLTLWKHLGRAGSLNVLGVGPPENQRLTTEISSRGRHTSGEEMYR